MSVANPFGAPYGARAAAAAATMARRGLSELAAFSSAHLTRAQATSAAIIAWRLNDVIANEAFAQQQSLGYHGASITERTASEASAAAHYTPPAPDGTQPGIYWIPLADLSANVPWLGARLKSTAYHEAIPGHHFQLAIQQESTELPRFRKLGAFGYDPAFGEGWALYSETVPKSIGVYSTHYDARRTRIADDGDAAPSRAGIAPATVRRSPHAVHARDRHEATGRQVRPSLSRAHRAPSQRARASQHLRECCDGASRH